METKAEGKSPIVNEIMRRHINTSFSLSVNIVLIGLNGTLVGNCSLLSILQHVKTLPNPTNISLNQLNPKTNDRNQRQNTLMQLLRII